MSTGVSASITAQDVGHGTRVPDQFRWLEDRKTLDTDQWLLQQQGVYDHYFSDKKDLLAQVEPVARRLLTEPDVDQVCRAADIYFYRARRGNAEQASIFMMDVTDGIERCLVDPSSCGDCVTVGIHQVTRDGAFLAYDLRQGGEHAKSIHCLDTFRGLERPDLVGRGLARGFAFLSDNSGFVFCQDSAESNGAPGIPHEIRHHDFGKSQANDQLVFSVPRGKRSKLVLISDPLLLGALFLYESEGILLSDLYVAEHRCVTTWRKVVAGEVGPFLPFLAQGRIFAYSTRSDPNGAILGIDNETAEVSTIVPGSPSPIRDWAEVNGTIYVSYWHGDRTLVRAWSRDGRLIRDIETPAGSNVTFFLPYCAARQELLVRFEAFSQIPTVKVVDETKAEFRSWVIPQRASPPLDLSISRERFVSKDGESIPITIVAPKCSMPDGPRPMVMTSYGGFGISPMPRFSPLIAILLEQGFAFALPDVRGGGGGGSYWHESGRRHKRQKSIDDFLGAAEWLIHRGLTTPDQLAIFGGSNSGLLVAACMVQHPELFGAVLCVSPLTDMLRYHLFDRASTWEEEYGTAEDPSDFPVLLSYSPYHNVRSGIEYPACLFVSGDSDTRCNPMHTRKMVAALQACGGRSNLVLLDYKKDRGHSRVAPLSVRIDSLCHRVAFLCAALKLTYQGTGEHDESSH